MSIHIESSSLTLMAATVKRLGLNPQLHRLSQDMPASGSSWWTSERVWAGYGPLAVAPEGLTCKILGTGNESSDRNTLKVMDCCVFYLDKNVKYFKTCSRIGAMDF